MLSGRSERKEWKGLRCWEVTGRKQGRAGRRSRLGGQCEGSEKQGREEEGLQGQCHQVASLELEGVKCKL